VISHGTEAAEGIASEIAVDWSDGNAELGGGLNSGSSDRWQSLRIKR